MKYEGIVTNYSIKLAEGSYSSTFLFLLLFYLTDRNLIVKIIYKMFFQVFKYFSSISQVS